MSEKLIYCEGENIFLDSLMTELAFAKSHGSELMEQKGLLAEKTASSWKVS